MKLLLIRAKATMHLIEMSVLTNDDDALTQANALRAMDTRDEYRIDILCPEPFAYAKSEFKTWTKDIEHEPSIHDTIKCERCGREYLRRYGICVCRG